MSKPLPGPKPPKRLKHKVVATVLVVAAISAGGAAYRFMTLEPRTALNAFTSGMFTALALQTLLAGIITARHRGM